MHDVVISMLAGLTAIIIIAIHLVVNSNDAHQLSPPFLLERSGILSVLAPECMYCMYSYVDALTSAEVQWKPYTRR